MTCESAAVGQPLNDVLSVCGILTPRRASKGSTMILATPARAIRNSPRTSSSGATDRDVD